MVGGKTASSIGRQPRAPRKADDEKFPEKFFSYRKLSNLRYKGKMPAALFIGRFQPLHKGHLFALRHIAAKSSRIYVVIGSAQEKRTEKNPFSARERMSMMKAVLVKEKLANMCRVFLLQDIPNDYEWVSYLDAHVPKYDVCYSNNALVLKLMRRSGKKIARVPLFARKKYNATSVRERMRKGKEWESRVPTGVREKIGKTDVPEAVKKIVHEKIGKK